MLRFWQWERAPTRPMVTWIRLSFDCRPAWRKENARVRALKPFHGLIWCCNGHTFHWSENRYTWSCVEWQNHKSVCINVLDIRLLYTILALTWRTHPLGIHTVLSSGVGDRMDESGSLSVRTIFFPLANLHKVWNVWCPIRRQLRINIHQCVFPRCCVNVSQPLLTATGI